MAAPPPPPALWTPQQEGVNQILQLLTEYMAPGANQQQVCEMCRLSRGTGGVHSAIVSYRERCLVKAAPPPVTF